MLTSRGWRAPPAVLFTAVLFAVVVFLVSHPSWDGAANPGSVARSTPSHPGIVAHGVRAAHARPHA